MFAVFARLAAAHDPPALSSRAVRATYGVRLPYAPQTQVLRDFCQGPIIPERGKLKMACSWFPFWAELLGPPGTLAAKEKQPGTVGMMPCLIISCSLRHGLSSLIPH